MKNNIKSIGSFGAKTHLSSLLEDVQKGSEYIITRRGKPIAKLVPFPYNEADLSISSVIDQFDSIRSSYKGKVNIKELISSGRKY